MRVVVLVCDKYLWCLRPFSYLFNIYWSGLQPVVVAGYKPPEFALPNNFQFYSISPDNYPPEKWSDGLIDFLDAFTDDYFTLMLEDYWLNRGVDHQAVESLRDYMAIHPEILRIDLTGDRLYSMRATDVESWGHLDMIETPNDCPYQLSLQACVISRENMLRILRRGMSPWQFETQDQSLVMNGLRVLGTRQMPVKYTNGVGSGHGALWTEGISPEHVQHMKEQGWI